jgi:pimeloyl-ACP methyl ester carboxylesterase
MIPNKFFEFNIPCKNPSKSLGNIVFIHGYCVDHQYFIIRDELTKYFNYYSIDLPGHGVNDKGVESKDLKLDNFADYVIDYIKTKKLTNVILMGHSMGGAVVSLVASKAPELITKLVLLCPLNFASIFMGIPALYAFFPKNMKQKMRLMRVLYKDHTLHSKEPL